MGRARLITPTQGLSFFCSSRPPVVRVGRGFRPRGSNGCPLQGWSGRQVVGRKASAAMCHPGRLPIRRLVALGVSLAMCGRSFRERGGQCWGRRAKSMVRELIRRQHQLRCRHYSSARVMVKWRLGSSRATAEFAQRPASPAPHHRHPSARPLAPPLPRRPPLGLPAVTAWPPSHEILPSGLSPVATDRLVDGASRWSACLPVHRSAPRLASPSDTSPSPPPAQAPRRPGAPRGRQSQAASLPPPTDGRQSTVYSGRCAGARAVTGNAGLGRGRRGCGTGDW